MKCRTYVVEEIRRDGEPTVGRAFRLLTEARAWAAQYARSGATSVVAADDRSGSMAAVVADALNEDPTVHGAGEWLEVWGPGPQRVARAGGSEYKPTLLASGTALDVGRNVWGWRI